MAGKGRTETLRADLSALAHAMRVFSEGAACVRPYSTAEVLDNDL